MHDLILLVPDGNMEQGFEALLSRHQALRIKRISFRILKHTHQDSGVLNEAHEFLRPFTKQYSYCLVVFDHEGCGRENAPIEDLEMQVESHLRNSGWDDRARVIVIDPELENWVWSDSPEVAKALGWREGQPPLRDWLSQNGYWPQGEKKPTRPKEVLESVLRKVNRPRSSAIYGELARSVGFQRCSDRSFLRLKDILESWFAR